MTHASGMALHFLLCLAVAIFSSVYAPATNAAEPALITAEEQPLALGPHMDFIEDESAELDFDTVRKLPHAGQSEGGASDGSVWQSVEGENIIGGFTDSAYWVRFTVRNTTAEARHWKLEINYPLLDHIEFYTPTDNGEYSRTLAGDKLPFAERPINYRNIVFPLNISGKAEQTYYLRVKTDSSMFIDLLMWPGNSFAEDIEGKLLLYGILYGIVLLGSIYCLVNWAFQGKRMYLHIALGILGSVGYLLGINGFGFQYLWPNSLYIQEVAVPFFMAACFGFALLYSREFLELPVISPLSDKIIVNFARLCLVLSVASLIVSYAVVIRISTVTAILTAFAALWAGIISYVRGNRFARFYMVGWSAVIIGATTFALKSLGLVPANVFTVWSQEFGFAFVAIFLTIALSDHFFQAQREHSEQQAKSIKAIKTAEKKYRSLFENAIEGIFQMDIDGRLINVNKAFASILGFNDVARLLEEKHVPFSLNCLAEADRLRFVALLEQEQPKTTFQTSINLYNGEQRWISISIQKIKTLGEAVSHYEGAMADITETKKREQAEKQQRMAEASTEAKSLFLANMSHEIRTPMNAIIGFTDLALGRNTDSQLAEYLQKTRMASTNLLGIINDILDFSKIEAGKLEIEHTPFSLKEVFNNLSNIVSANVESKNLTLNLNIDEDIPDKLVGDPLRIGQVLLNLTNNAIKFTAEGEVTVELELVSLNKPEMSIELIGRVQDTGIGIAEEKLKNLFSSFTQADESTTRRFGGTGLGLSISKQLIEMMGGELWVESTVGEGSTFHFRFACKLQDRRQRRNPHFTSQGEPLNVLVVDDQQESRTLIEQALLSLAHNVTCVSNSGEAIVELKARQETGTPYDVLIADWLMPDIDGIACCQIIKEDPDIHTPRTILITGYDQDEAREKAEQVGIDAYMLKPVRVDDLANVLRRVFHDRRAPDSAPKRMPEPAHFQGMQVLLVEDVSMNQELAIEILSKKGIEIRVANNGKEGVEAVKNGEFDVVLMDMQMPVMDGCEATMIIRETEHKLPIIAMTANAMAGDKHKCLAAGMNDYITKPINPDELFMTIGKWTGAFGNMADASEESGPEADSAQVPEQDSNTETTQTAADSDQTGASDDSAPESPNEASSDETGEDALETAGEASLENNGEASSPLEEPEGIEASNGAEDNREDEDKAEALQPPSNMQDYYDQLNQTLQESETEEEQEDEQHSAEADIPQQKFPGVDISEGLERCQGNLQLYLRFLSDFSKNYGDSAATMKQLAVVSEFKELADLAHRIKGVAANLGARPVAAITGELQMVNDRKTEDLDNKLDRYEEALRTFLESIDQILREQASTDDTPAVTEAQQADDTLEREACMAGLEELAPLIKRQKLDAHSVAEALLTQWPDDADKANLQKLVVALDNYDFQQAETLLGDIRQSL